MTSDGRSAKLATAKRRRSEAQEEDERKPKHVVVESEMRESEQSGADEEEKAPIANGSLSQTAQEEEEEESDGEEALVVLELCDFKNHPLFDDYSTATLEGIDTATPVLKIGEYALHGQLEETVGTSYFYDTDTATVPDKTYQFAGQTIKKIKFTIAPPEEP